MKEEKIIQIICDYVKNECNNGKSVNDWWHTWRIYQESLKINKYEKSNEFIISLIALLHGLFDNNLDSNIDIKSKIITLLEGNKIKRYISDTDINSISNNILNLFYLNKNNELSIEGKIVQDAHIIDDLGFVAIHRFLDGFKINKSIYYLNNKKINTDIKLSNINLVAETENEVVNYFKKIVKLKNFLNTDYAKMDIEKGHILMLDYLIAIYDKDYSDVL